MYSICLRDHEEAVLVSIKFELKYVNARMTFPVPQYVNISSISIKFKKKKKKKRDHCLISYSLVQRKSV